MEWRSLEKEYDSMGMKKNIEAQGDSIELTLRKELERIREVAHVLKDCKRFVFSGAGDKYLVPMITEFLWNHISKKPLNVIHSRVFADYVPEFLDDDVCVVLISQSGTTLDTIEACRTAIDKGCVVVSITNLKEEKKTSLVSLCESYEKGYVLRTHTKFYPERPLPSTCTFHTSLLVLNLLALFLNDANEEFFNIQINHIPRVVHDLSNSDEVRSEAKEYAVKLKNFDNFHVVGDGPRYGIARKHGRIMLMEGVKTNACAVESEEFLHSLIETLESKIIDPLIIMKPLDSWKSSIMSYKLIKNLWLRYGGKDKVCVIDPFRFLNQDVKRCFSGIEGNLLSPFLYAVVSSWHAYYLALIKRKDPGVAKLVSKVREEKEVKRLIEDE